MTSRVLVWINPVVTTDRQKINDDRYLCFYYNKSAPKDAMVYTLFTE